MEGGQKLASKPIVMEQAAGRIRKVTLTEIVDGEEWNWPDPGELEDSDTEIIDPLVFSDEIFNSLDSIVQDWKLKLEWIVADGLRKLRRCSREKKQMMKYIPGDGIMERHDLIVEAKSDILKKWKTETRSTMELTNRKLTGLMKEKIKETEDSVAALRKQGTYKSAVSPLEDVKSSVDMAVLMQDLEKLYRIYSEKNMCKIPIYNEIGMDKMRNSHMPWWKPVCTLLGMINFPLKKALTFQSEEEVLDVLQDFSMDYKSRRNIMNEWSELEARDRSNQRRKFAEKLKPQKRPSNSAMKMTEANEKKRFVIKEYEDKKGNSHVYLVKQNADRKNNTEDAADIYADWLSSLKGQKQRKPRTRKLSHRAERRELLQRARSETMGPLTYAQALAKNLKRTEQPPVEDIFESWMPNLNMPAKMAASPATSAAGLDMVDIFHPWRHNLHVPRPQSEDVDILNTTHCIPSLALFHCGAPTVKMPSSPRQHQRQQARQFQPQWSPKNELMKKSKGKWEKDAKTRKAKLIQSKQHLPQKYVKSKTNNQDIVTMKKTVPQANARQEMMTAKPRAVFPQVKATVHKSTVKANAKPSAQIILNARERKIQQRKALKSFPTEVVFAQWRHILAANEPQEEIFIKSAPQPEAYFRQWLRHLDNPGRVTDVTNLAAVGNAEEYLKDWLENLREPCLVKQRLDLTKNDMNRGQEEEEELDCIKDNRRHDFAKGRRIKEKKRTEAQRKSTGKRTK